MSAPTMSDQAILDFWNGRPTLVLTVQDGIPKLWWMVIGQNEPYDIWWTMAISWDDADAITARPAEFDVRSFIESTPSENVEAFLTFSQGRTIVSSEAPLRWVGHSDGTAGIIKHVLARLESVLRSRLNEDPRLTQPIRSVERLLAG